MMSGRWRDIEAMLSERIGLDPESVGSNLILKAVELRISELGLRSLDDYVSRLAGSPTELQALIEEVVIPESWFFRDEAPFHFFQEHVRADWLANPGRRPLRVLSIPCAAGEEPYSIVIALLEIGLGFERFQVDAVDVSIRRLEMARRGVFSQNAFRGSNLTFRDRYFQVHPQGFALDPAIRSGVRFLQGNILDPALLTGEPSYDVVFCRNLLIYLDRSSRGRVMATLNRLIATDGHLVVGHADRVDLSGCAPVLGPVNKPQAFTYRRATALPPVPFVAALPPPRNWISKSVMHSSKQAQVAPPGPASPPMGTKTTAHDKGKPRSSGDYQSARGSAKTPSANLLEQAAELANLRRYDDAIAACEKHLRAEGPSAEAYYLQGVIHQSQGNRVRGEECFHRAAYLDPGHDEALLALALSAERRGDVAAATVFRRRAERAAVKKGAQ